MWGGVGVVQPSVTPAPRQTLTTSRSHVADQVLPGVTLLLLFCCCYLFTDAVRWDDEGESFASGARSSQGVIVGEGFLGFFGRAEVDLAPTWRPAEHRTSQWTEGKWGQAICGTDMVDMSQMVPGSDGTTRLIFILTGFTFSHTVSRGGTFTLVFVSKSFSCTF